MEKLEEMTEKLNKIVKKKNNISEYDLNSLSAKIVTRMVNIQTMQTWYDHVRDSPLANDINSEKLDMTEEEEAIADAAKYMTLMNLYEDKEEYEKCAICKLKLDQINKTLKKY